MRLFARSLQAFRRARRNFGSGGGHDHGHHDSHLPVGPYSPKHHSPYPNEAHLFGIKPGDKPEGWEVLTYTIYFLCFGVIVAGEWTKDDSFQFKTWARMEALAREKVVENGGEVEFGKYYHANRFTEESVDGMPSAKEE